MTALHHPYIDGAIPRGSILEAFICVPDCPTCLGTGHVCEDHPTKAWGDIIGQGSDTEPGTVCWCGAAGAPCPTIEQRKAARP